MRFLFITIMLFALLHSKSLTAQPEIQPTEWLVIVRYVEVAGGFYGFETLDGQRLLAPNIAEEFRQAGLRLRIVGEIRPNMLGIHLWGQYIRLFEIQAIDCEQPTESTAALCAAEI
jgi:hypothetical protein